MKAINVRVADDIKAKLDAIAAAERRSVRQQIELLVDQEWQLAGYGDDEGNGTAA
jgi:predicted transcriptional regulator